MKVKEITEALQLRVLAGEKGLDKEVKGGYVSDLLSDVMGNSREGDVWITLQTHRNVLAIASLRDLAAIILVNGHQPDTDMAEQAQEENIPILGTEESTFNISGKLYKLLNK
jgi:predicted transcriptional regulator